MCPLTLLFPDPDPDPFVFFSLYIEFKTNPIFQQQLEMDKIGNASMISTIGGGGGGGGDESGGWRGGGASEANVMTF